MINPTEDNVTDFFSDACCWSCNYCGEFVGCDTRDLLRHLDSCEDFAKRKKES